MLNGVAFSNGVAEFVLKKPPPFDPSCLIATWLATGPPGIACLAPVTVCTSLKPCRFWTTPPMRKMTANTSASGMRMRRVVRTRSTQKFPMVLAPARARPRMSATITAMPAAAETKFWTVRPIACVRWLTVVSG